MGINPLRRPRIARRATYSAELDNPYFDARAFDWPKSIYIDDLVENTTFVKRSKDSKWEPIIDGALEELSNTERAIVLKRLRDFGLEADEAAE